MRQDEVCSRKIAANYIFWPGYPLIRNGYLVWQGSGRIEVKQLEGQVREMAGLEFYGGMLVPDYVQTYWHDFENGAEVLPCLRRIIERENLLPITGIALIEGADWKGMRWQKTARIRRVVS